VVAQHLAQFELMFFVGRNEPTGEFFERHRPIFDDRKQASIELHGTQLVFVPKAGHLAAASLRGHRQETQTGQQANCCA